VDDEPSIRTLAKRILEGQGYRVLLAEDGLDALETFAEMRQQIGLVILDLTMPRLSGQDTFRRLREIEPGVRVLLSSGSASFSGASYAPHLKLDPKAGYSVQALADGTLALDGGSGKQVGKFKAPLSVGGPGALSLAGRFARWPRGTPGRVPCPSLAGILPRSRNPFLPSRSHGQRLSRRVWCVARRESICRPRD